MGADGIREKDGVKLAPRVLFTQVAYFPRVSEAIQGYMRKIGVDWKIVGYDSTIAPAKMAEQDYELWTVTFPYMSAGDLLNFYFDSKNMPAPNRMNWNDPQTDELPAQGQGVAERRRPRQVLRARPAARHRGASLDAGDERRHVRHQQQEAEGRAAAHALSEHLLQGPGLLVLMDKLLEVRGLRDPLPHRPRPVPRRRRHRLLRRPRPDRGPGRRIGLRQERDLALGHGPGARARPAQVEARVDPVRGPRPARPARPTSAASCAAARCR